MGVTRDIYEFYHNIPGPTTIPFEGIELKIAHKENLPPVLQVLAKNFPKILDKDPLLKKVDVKGKDLVLVWREYSKELSIRQVV